MLAQTFTLAALLAAPVQPGQVVWIGLRPARREPMIAVADVEALMGQGLCGDRYRTRSDGSRQVTLIEAESLAAIASYLRRADIAPELLRRNIVVRGINLRALKGRRFRIGEALLEYSGECHPCSRMEEVFGEGGYNAVRGHGGITARVMETGTIRLQDLLAVQRPD